MEEKTREQLEQAAKERGIEFDEATTDGQLREQLKQNDSQQGDDAQQGKQGGQGQQETSSGR